MPDSLTTEKNVASGRIELHVRGLAGPPPNGMTMNVPGNVRARRASWISRPAEDGPQFAYAVQDEVAIGPETVRFVARTMLRPDFEAPFGRTDLRRIGGLAIATAGLAIRRADDATRLITGLTIGRPVKCERRTFRNSLAAVDGRAADEADALYDRLRTHEARELVTLARELTGWGSAPEIAFPEAERLRTALADGMGAIVWVSETWSASILAKRALWEHGFSVAHVSASSHGLSPSLFGKRFLNRLPRHVENRFLSERLAFGQLDGVDVTRRVVRSLQAGKLVSMTNNTFAGSGFVELAFGRTGWLKLSTTVLGLAARCGAPVIPMTLIEDVPLRRYRVTLGPTLRLPAGVRAGRSRSATAALAAESRDHLLEMFRAVPDQFNMAHKTDMSESVTGSSGPSARSH